MTISWRIEEESASKNIHLFCKFCAVVCRRLLTSSHSCCSCCSKVVAVVVVVMLVRCIVPIKSNQYFGYWQCKNTRGKGEQLVVQAEDNDTFHEALHKFECG